VERAVTWVIDCPNLNSTKFKKGKVLPIRQIKNLEINKNPQISNKLGGVRGVAPQKWVTDRKSLDL
jgi:hypothetical protein